VAFEVALEATGERIESVDMDVGVTEARIEMRW